MTKQEREEILKNDLSDLNVGDKVWIISYGETSVSHIGKRENFPINCGDYSTDSSGRSWPDHSHPMLFRSLDHCIRYFQALKEEQEEASKWTWEKIQKCERIGFGTYVLFPEREGELVIISIKGAYQLSYIAPSGLHLSRRYNHPNADWTQVQFFNRAGNLIDPREY